MPTVRGSNNSYTLEEDKEDKKTIFIRHVLSDIFLHQFIIVNHSMFCFNFHFLYSIVIVHISQSIQLSKIT